MITTSPNLPLARKGVSDMGYYTGIGVETSGGETVSLKEQIIWYGTHNIYQKTRTTTQEKKGVSLATAKAENADSEMSNQTWASGTIAIVSTNCKGTNKSVSYQQIGNSNLYTLQIITQTIKVKDGFGWLPTGWIS